MGKTGVWLIGARGNVATTAITGAVAIRQGLTGTTGMVTASAPLAPLDLPPIDDLVFAGHEIRSGSLVEKAERLSERNGVPDRETVETVSDDLAEIDSRIRIGSIANASPVIIEMKDEDDRTDGTLDGTVDTIQDDLASFTAEHELDRTVVLNVASTEPPVPSPDKYDSVTAIERAIADDDPDLPTSTLYAYAAIAEGHPYVNFTPSPGSSLGGIRELARDVGVPHMGRDAKTGETLVKSALAPMFAGRNLRVRTWEGHNLLGNTDGRVLQDEANEAGKLQSKGGLLDALLPELEHNAVRIDYAPSLGDWKTAWDYIHFEGFLDTEMSMRFTWEGSDSALAAPLVLDLARLLAHADAHNETGSQPHLASFFKAPLDVDDHDLTHQFDDLYAYVDRFRTPMMEHDGR